MNLDFSQFGDLVLTDPNFCIPDSIDLILGSDIYCQILRSGLRRFPSTSLIAQNTVLGWVVSGSMVASSPRRADSVLQTPLAAMHSTHGEELHEALEQFWKIEEFADPFPKIKPEDKACEQLYANIVSRNLDGRYQVRLPLKSDPPNIADDSRAIAMGSLSSMYRRFNREPELAVAYREFMKQYLELGHMQKIPEHEIDNRRAWYIPHHAVVQSDPWKLRVVFDASRRCYGNPGLNEFLISGPALQSDISLILLQWREYRFVFTADIVKTFRQILVHPEDQDLQRILWSPYPNNPPAEYRLLTVTYGTACAPFLAIRTLRQLVLDERHRFPLGACCLQDHTYVDDVFAGDHELELAIRKRDDLCSILRSAGIELDKWDANCLELLPCHDTVKDPLNNKEITMDESVKTLGLRWNPAKDLFEFSFHNLSPQSHSPTKRSVLSNIAQIFDPLGWLAPITVTAKILMQDLWILRCEWDSPLRPEIFKRWGDYIRSMSSVSTVSINRWFGIGPKSHCQLHGFADASSRAYAAAVYLRAQLENGETQISLLMAKTKVSPVKTLSIPNLELNAGALLVKLVCSVRKLTTFKHLPIYSWSDSQIVLAWLRKHPCHWKTFVANRVSFIQTELPSSEWRYVPTKDNPADLATRGLTPAELQTSQIWWDGPAWLASPKTECPKQPEYRALHALPQSTEPEIFTRFSNLTRLIRVVAYCLRPLLNLRKRKKGEEINSNFLTTSELTNSRLVLIRLSQKNVFSAKIDILKSKGCLPKRNPLRKLNPFVGEDKILRVGGRLSHSSLPHETKHPPILPRLSALSRLFIHQAHISSLHGGFTFTMSFLNQHAWILGRTRLVKTEIHYCIICQRVKPRLAPQLIGELPSARVTPARPFSTSGVDYAGPIQIRTTKGRGHRSYKGYIALFVCFRSHAIHLEVVSDMTTAAFLSAYRQFVGRRGLRSHLYSELMGGRYKGD